jgi:hypothetical protein
LARKNPVLATGGEGGSKKIDERVRGQIFSSLISLIEIREHCPLFFSTLTEKLKLLFKCHNKGSNGASNIPYFLNFVNEYQPK